MDYTDLAIELLTKMKAFHKIGPQKFINEAMQGESFVLKCLAFHHGGMLPGEISDEMNVSSARVAAALNSLENKGLITREIDKRDRRRILVTLTPQGRELTEKHQRVLIEAVVKMLSQLGEHDAREYVRISGRLAALAPECEKIE